MKTLVAILMTALFVFAVATAWVDYVQPQLDRVARTEAPKASQESTAAVKKRTKRVSVDSDDELLPVPEDEIAAAESVTPRRERKAAVSARRLEETRTLLSEQLEDVKERESRVASRQDALELIYANIRLELAEMDQLRKQTTEELAAAERVRSTDQKRPSPSRDAVAARLNSRTAGPKSRDSLKNITRGDEAHSQAFMLMRLVNEGNLESAVSILKTMKERDAARILESISSVEPRLADRLADGVSVIHDAPRRQ